MVGPERKEGPMRRVVLVLIGAALVAVIPAVHASASGGGGCGAAVSEETGEAVAIRQFCFEPTVLVAPAGTEVMFLNQDPVPHNVLGANASWGSFARLGGGKSKSYRFDAPGVYPYVCSWHPGMVGAIVVEETAQAAVPSTPVARVGQASGSGPWKPLAVAAGGFLLLVVIGTAGLRRRVERGPAA
jgi:plastocyanin